MKVIVSHVQKQHVYHLISALQKKQFLSVFFTGVFFGNGKVTSFLYKKSLFFKKIIDKRSSKNISKHQVISTYIPEFFYRIFKANNSKKSLFILERTHDLITSFLQKFQEYDVIIGYEGQCLFTFKEAKKRGKITILDLASIHPREAEKINNDFEKIICDDANILEKSISIKEQEYNNADYIITLSNFAKESCLRSGFNAKNVFKLQLGVDSNFFSKKEIYHTDKFEILFVAGVRFLKGIGNVIEAFKLLNLKNSNLTIIGGPGNALSYVRSNCNEQIKYVSFISHEELKVYYQKSSIFVMPSYMDSWGQVVCEAMSCGTPVVVSENTGSKDIVINGENGFIIKPGNNKELMEKITYFYENRHEIERMGRNARLSVANLTWQRYEEKIEEILEKITYS